MADLPVLRDDRGVPRVLAALPPRPWQPIPRLAATAVVLPRSQWQEIDLADTYKPPLTDQGQTNSCTGHMAKTVCEVCWLQTGRPLVPLSPTFAYALCNGGRDEGAVISDIVVELGNTGLPPEADCPEGVIFKRQIPQKAFQEAARFRLGRQHHVPSFDEIGTALTLGMPVGAGFLLGQNFMRPGPDGVAPVPDRVIGGHALPLLGLINRGGKWLVKFPNSWGRSWGLQGYGYLSEEFINYSVEVTRRQWGADLDAFAAESLLPDPGDAEPVAPAPAP
jgi:hypothetical protein